MSERPSIPIDQEHYDCIKKQYDKAVADGLEEFDCELPDGNTWPLLVSYAYYLLEYMNNMLNPTHNTGE